MARSVALSFYDCQLENLPASSLRVQLVNPDGTLHGSETTDGIAAVVGAPSNYVWSGEVDTYFDGFAEFRTADGRVLGVSDFPQTRDDIGRAVWQYALPSGSDAGAAIGYVEEAANAAAAAANQAKVAAQAVPNNLVGFELQNGTLVEEALLQAAQSATEAAYNANQAKLSADQAARPGAAMTLTPAERNAVADATLDRADGVEQGLTLRQHLRIVGAVLFGKAVVSGGQVKYKRRDGTTDAVTVTFTETGARPASTIGGV